MYSTRRKKIHSPILVIDFIPSWRLFVSVSKECEHQRIEKGTEKYPKLPKQYPSVERGGGGEGVGVAQQIFLLGALPRGSTT